MVESNSMKMEAFMLAIIVVAAAAFIANGITPIAKATAKRVGDGPIGPPAPPQVAGFCTCPPVAGVLCDGWCNAGTQAQCVKSLCKYIPAGSTAACSDSNTFVLPKCVWVAN